MKERINEEFNELVKRKFDAIYYAALEKNDLMIKNILETSSHLLIPRMAKEVNPLSIKIDRKSPVCLLAMEGSHDSVNFLINYGADKFEAVVGYKVVKDDYHAEEILGQLKPDELSKWDKISMAMSCANLSVIDYEAVCKELDEFPFQYGNIDEVTIEFAAYFGKLEGLAYKGVTKDLLIEMHNKYARFNFDHDEEILKCYAYGNHDLNIDLDNMSNSDIQNIAFGYALAGNLEKINNLYSNFSLFQKAWVSKYLLRGFYQAGFMQHPEILAYINFSLKTESNFKNRTLELFKANNLPIKSFTNEFNYTQDLKKSYQINIHQKSALLHFENFIWILQGIQLVKKNIVTMDLFIKISTYLFNLSIQETEEINEQIRFKYLKDFLINDIGKYAGSIENVVTNFFDQIVIKFDEKHKKTYPHYDRANSFLQSCKEATNTKTLESLITNQFRLFSNKAISTESSSLEHDKNYECDENDDFTKAIVRHNNRVMGL